MATSKPARTGAFISYSHADSTYLLALQRHLKPLLRDSTVQVWDDTQIEAGANWREEIERALASARVAILLVSANFLASDFIAGEELPQLLAAARDEGARILPVMLSPSVFRHTPLSQFQTVNDPARPLSAMPAYEQEEVWVRLAETVYEALSAPLPIGARLLTYAGQSGSVLDVAWSPNGRSLASAGSDKTIQVLDTKGNGLLVTCAGHEDLVFAVAWSPSGRSLASASMDGTVRMWDAATGRPGGIYKDYDDAVCAVAWSPDGTRIACGGYGNAIHVWDASNGQRLVLCEGHSAFPYALAWSPDGKRIASASMDATVRVWEAASGTCLITYTGHSAEVMDVAWSPVPLSKNYTGAASTMPHTAGYLLASASADKTVQVWDASNGECFVTYTGHAQPVNGVAWSPDGSLLASGCGQAGDVMPGTVQVWHASGGQPLFTYTGHAHGVNSVAWSPSGSTIASADQSGALHVWSAGQLAAR